MATNAPVFGEATASGGDPTDFLWDKIKKAFGIGREASPEDVARALYPFALQKLGGVTGSKRSNPS